MEKLDDLLQPGVKLRIFYRAGNPNNRDIEIRAIVDDDHIVYRYHSKKHGWQYSVEDKYQFELWLESGRLTRIS